MVTYNPELVRLRENLSAVAPQVDQVFVFDNGSTNQGAVEDLVREFPNAELIRSSENLGLSKALNALARACLDYGAAWGFFLDQDSVSSDGMVASLIGTAQKAQESSVDPVGEVGPAVYERNLGLKNIDVPAGTEFVDVRSVITSGSLVNLAAWEAVGGYDEDLFLDWVDFDFSYALRRAGYRVLLSGATTLTHEMGNREILCRLPAWLPFHVPFTQKDAEGRQLYFRMDYAPFRWRGQMESLAVMEEKYSDTQDAGFLRFSSLCTFFRALAFERNRPANVQALVDGYRNGKRLAKRKRGGTHGSDR